MKRLNIIFFLFIFGFSIYYVSDVLMTQDLSDVIVSKIDDSPGKNRDLIEKIFQGIILEDETEIYGDAVILTTGTYLKADILVGDTRRREGPHGEKPSNHLSDNLKKLGLTIQRLKTGTPPRELKDTINYEECQEEKGDEKLLSFSNFFKPVYNIESQHSCFLTYTNQTTHKIILENLDKCGVS